MAKQPTGSCIHEGGDGCIFRTSTDGEEDYQNDAYWQGMYGWLDGWMYRRRVTVVTGRCSKSGRQAVQEVGVVEVV